MIDCKSTSLELMQMFASYDAFLSTWTREPENLTPIQQKRVRLLMLLLLSRACVDPSWYSAAGAYIVTGHWPETMISPFGGQSHGNSNNSVSLMDCG
jgi:hypothetical protein